MTALLVIVAYLAVLLGVGLASTRFFQGTGSDFFLASHSIGPVLLLLSLFGTTMTAFALVGSTGEAYVSGVGTYGLMASWSGAIHPLMFAFLGVPIWHLGRRHGYVTQIQYLRDRFQSEALGWLLFPILVLLVVPYLLIGIQGAGITVAAVTKGVTTTAAGAPAGVPPWLTGLVICGVVLAYVGAGGIRAAAWANAFQTGVFLVVAMIAFVAIVQALGGPEAAAAATAAKRPELLAREGLIEPLHFLTYAFVPLSVGTFPHIFQHWLTARSPDAFKLSVVAHPLLIAVVWVPCVLIGVWAGGQLDLPPEQANKVLGIMVARFTSPVMSGVLTAGILAAIMSSLDSQFLALGSMFTHDVVLHRDADVAPARQVWLGRVFVVAVVAVTYVLSLFESRSVFDLGVWCFSGFAGLTPVMFAAVYWRRATRAGALAAVLVGGAAWLAMFVADATAEVPGELLPLGLAPATYVVLATTLALGVVSLVTAPPDEAHLRRFFRPVGA
ncbi:MAG: sodium:solute symporter family protein [Alphaproteobacteria bacterium]|nr:sodium:solute symporter family protein [Alphaproteobacteria bacterium]